MDFIVSPETIERYGFSVICFFVFIVVFVRNNRLAEKRFTKIETELDESNNFIRVELKDIIRDQQKVISQNNEAIAQNNLAMHEYAKEFKRLCRFVGMLGRVDKNINVDEFEKEEHKGTDYRDNY